MAAQSASVSPQLDVWEKGIAAGSAAIISTLVANPLELIKTRMQTSLTASPSAPGPSQRAALALSTTSGQNWHLGAGAPQHMAPNYTYRSALDGLLRIARTEGPAVLWRGTDLSLLVAVPMVALYFPLYDVLLNQCQSTGIEPAPFIGGAVARTVTAYAISPLELLRVRVQGSHRMSPPNTPYLQQLTQVARQIHHEAEGRGIAKLGGLWRGMGLTLAKDVPFAAAYWTLLEPLRASLLPPQEVESSSRGRVFAANAAAGFCAAGLAAGVTTPLDVAKTHAQTAPKRLTITGSFSDIVRRGGYKALWTGVGPRSLRAGCAYAILMSSYEAFKLMELKGHLAHTQQSQ